MPDMQPFFEKLAVSDGVADFAVNDDDNDDAGDD